MNEPFGSHPLNQSPSRWNWKIISLWIAIGIQFLLLLAVAEAKSTSGTNIGDYNKICWQNGIYNNQTGVENTVWYPCTSEVP